MTVEIDSRTIPGNGGFVHWLLDQGQHRIVVFAPDGQQAAVLTPTKDEAREVYLHPFAYKAVPDIFRRQPDE